MRLAGRAEGGRAYLGVLARRALLPKEPVRLACGRRNYWHYLIAPILLSTVAVLLTSLLMVETHAHLTALHIWHDPEDLVAAYILPTIWAAMFFGSDIGVWSALLSGLAAAYFVYPPEFSIAIEKPEDLIELGFFLVLLVTASKSTAILRDERPLNRRPARKLNEGERLSALRRRWWRRRQKST
jgi:K+-sensing histidine kinase KdpD